MVRIPEIYRHNSDRFIQLPEAIKPLTKSTSVQIVILI